MFINLAGLPGKIKQLYDYLTSNVDVTVSSRAPASTALSNAVWTNTRANKLDQLDQLDAAISSRLATAVKSVQRGTFSFDAPSLDITIAAVDIAKALVILQPGQGWAGGSYGNYLSLPYGVLIDATTLRIYYPGSASGPPCTGSWQVIEYK